MPIRQERELCGLCNNPDTDYFCGDCEQGLECVFEFADRFNQLLESRCQKKTGNDSLPSMTILSN